MCLQHFWTSRKKVVFKSVYLVFTCICDVFGVNAITSEQNTLFAQVCGPSLEDTDQGSLCEKLPMYGTDF